MANGLKILRWARIAVAVAVFALISAQFIDIYHQLPRAYYRANPVATQFAPSLIKWLAAGAVVSGAAFISFCATALVFGRWYCASFCAFGILMDAMRAFARFAGNLRFVKKTKIGAALKKRLTMRHRKALTALRAAMLAIAAALIACGYTTLFGFIEPYSLYGKIMGSAVHPALAKLANAASAELYKCEIYAVEPINGDPSVPLAIFGLALLILFAAAAASILRGRIFCNTLCPVGALLGGISKFSLLRLSLDKSKCVSCGMCERNCKSECINAKEKSLDFTRCVLCLNCAKNCPKGAVKISLNSIYRRDEALPQSAKSAEFSAPAAMPRRKFGAAFGALAAMLFAGAKADAQTADKKAGNISPYGQRGRRPDKRLTAPPGSGGLQNFLDNCTACQICTVACKAQILKPSTGEWGLSHFMQPFMDFTDGFCLYDCHSCSKACPTGAIKFVKGKEKKSIKIGTAIFNENLCIVKTDGTDCAACGEHCPVQAIEMLPYGDKKNSLFIPHVHPEVCIGCGACESICPVRPHRAIVVQGLETHIKAKKFEESMRIYKLPKEEPEKQKSGAAQSPFPF